jgi:hypothetical protein
MQFLRTHDPRANPYLVPVESVPNAADRRGCYIPRVTGFTTHALGMSFLPAFCNERDHHIQRDSRANDSTGSQDASLDKIDSREARCYFPPLREIHIPSLRQQRFIFHLRVRIVARNLSILKIPPDAPIRQAAMRRVPSLIF